MAEDILAALTTFYKDKETKIYSCEFHCEHFDKENGSCKEAAKKAISGEKEQWEKRAKAFCEGETKPRTSDHEWEKFEEERKALLRHGQFTKASSAYVGEKYESNESRCRLLFLSLDPGSDDSSDDTWPREFRGLWCSKDDPLRRTPEGMRAGVIKKDGVKRKWVHWYGTHCLAARILQEAADDPARGRSREVCKVLEDSKADRKEKEKKLPDVTPYFAHANVVKCSIGKLKNAQAPTKMYRNCRGYLRNEIPLLKPDIIVTQGNEAADSLKLYVTELGNFSGGTDRCKRVFLCDHEVLWIRTYHPRYGRFWTEGKREGGVCWEVYADNARKFMAEKRHAS